MESSDEGATIDWVKSRRQWLAPYVVHTNENRDFVQAEKPEPIGLAFSGGGIRSATISLGITQLLVRRNRFSAFDYVSTASGGGYFGSFLRSLFLPSSARGQQAAGAGILEEDERQAAFYHAHNVLGAGPRKGDVPSDVGLSAHREGQGVNNVAPAQAPLLLRLLSRLVGHGQANAEPEQTEPVRTGESNPIWWLRENGRYLAPNGATDYLMALSYIARNWTATLFMMALAMTGLAVLLQLMLTAGLYLELSFDHPFGPSYRTYSPFLAAPLACFLLSVGIGVGYWMTQAMRYNPGGDGEARSAFWITWTGTAFAFLIALYMSALLAIPGKVPTWMAASPLLPFDIGWLVTELPPPAKVLIFAGTAILGMAISSSFVAYFLDGDGENPTSLIRRRLTRWSTWLNQAAIWCLAAALVDTAALFLREEEWIWSPSDGFASLWTLMFYPAIAFLIKKLPEWFSGSGGGISGWIGKHASSAAVFGAILLYASLAVFADLAVHMALWEGAAWQAASADWPTFGLFAVIVAALLFMTGISTGFANLSSLHALYSSRLTRAYLGASNRDRMRKRKDVSEGHQKDFIDAKTYAQADIPAPLHIINLTLNQTRGSNELVRRDRKGRRFAVGPEGITIDGAVNRWTMLEQNGAEKFSVGQLAAISGAAASSAMGRMTSLGAALGLTFANVRLGYWWDRGKHALNTGDEAGILSRTRPRTFGTFTYFFNEMTSRFSLDYRHYYLSDGGHSENSGALELLDRRCKFILVSDNGQDENFLFADLEIFIRTARIDLGFEISVANIDDTKDYVGLRAAPYFFNLLGRNWRQKLKEDDGSAFALLLKARLIGNKQPGAVSQDDDFTAHIIWLKPRIFEGISTDIASYAAQNAPFPHQSTIDQFFDEAQWESYRRLGYEMASCLFRDEKALTDVPVIKLKKQSEVKAIAV